MTKKDEVAVQANTQLAVATMYEEDAGAGFENADSSAYAIPFLQILQSGSPQVKKSDGAYIKGAEEGMLFNSVTQQLIAGDTGVTVIPVYYKRTFIKWAPDNGGFKGEILPSDPAIAANLTNTEGYLIDKDGNELSDTRTHYVLVLDSEGGFQPAVISLSSTQIKKSRTWMAKMNGIQMTRADGTRFTPPMFSHRYKITTVPEQNDKGSWFGWKIETVAPVDSAELYAAAKAFRDAVSNGEVKEQVPVSNASASSEEF